MTQRTNAKNETILHKAVVQWKTNPIFSTACVLVLMIILQTLALGFDFESIGAWFSHWSRNWINILRNNASVGIVALGMTFVIISGGIDLAVGSTLVAVGAVLMVCVNSYPTGLLTGIGITGVPAFIIGIAACILMGCALGGVSGFLIAKQKLPAFIATLGMMKICRSVTQQVMQTASVKVPTQFLAIANTKIGGQVILPIIYWLVLAVLLHIISRKTTFGRHVYAIGSNERTARLSGINVDGIIVACNIRAVAEAFTLAQKAGVLSGCRLMGIDPEEVPYIGFAERWGAGSTEIREDDIIPLNEPQSSRKYPADRQRII